jgi:chromosome segregation protein
LLKLKRVELLGFKSFADRTRLQFADGIAAVVGPNGCGKSNLADAISWVLGEQSAQSLRGERMADVIFNGTGTRPGTSMAEVSLTLLDAEFLQADAGTIDQSPQQGLFSDSDAPVRGARARPTLCNEDGPSNAARRPALQHRAGEITVTRRLFRSGESEYLINGELCRLRDIQDLFMGTGLGPESYAIIEQGRIGQILSSKPSDRRLIIEEAAGVSKFKTRKRLAEAKLETSRQNLARITDILEEVIKQVNSLKRQAAKARRFRELQDELRSRLKVVLTSRLAALEVECGRLGEESAALQAACSAAAQRLEDMEREQKAAAVRHEELESRLTQLREALARGDLERARLSARIEQLRQQAATLAARGSEAAAEGEQLQAQLATLELQAAERALQAEQLQRDWSETEKAARQLLAQQEELGAQLVQGESEVEACRQALLAAVSHLADLRNQLVQAEEAGLALDRQAARTATERAIVEEERQRLARELESLVQEQQRDESALGGLAQLAAETAAGLERARAEEVTRRRDVEGLRQDLSAATARKQALGESLARHAYATESVRRLLSDNGSGNGSDFHAMGVLADFVEVSPGYEEVVEEFLKDELDCVVVERHEEARSGISLLKSEGAGRSTFFVTRCPANGHTNGHDDQEIRGTRGVLGPVSDLVRFQPRLGLNGDTALPTLANAYVVEDALAAEHLAMAYPDCHFLTMTGEHYHHRLVAGGKGRSAGPLALRRDFRDLERRTTHLESSLRAAEATLAEAAARATQLEEELRHLSAAKLEAEKKAVLASEKVRHTQEAVDRSSERLRILGDEIAAMEAERDANQERQAKLRAQLEAAAGERVRREEEVSRAAHATRELRGQMDRLAQNLADTQARSSVLEERNHAVEAERLRLHIRGEEVRAHLARLAEQRQGWAEEQQRLAEEIEASQARLSELECEHMAALAEQQALEQECQTARARRDELTASIEAARLELEALRGKHSEAGIALARAESDVAHQMAQCREELRAEPGVILAELPAERILSGEPLTAAEAQLRELRTRLENLGPVNMMALEELQEAEDRYAFLETQRQDLLASIEDTAQAIKEIDQVSRQQFLEAFKAINVYFAESFRSLFGGGIGEMRLTDETDADSGIDIVAQPPGKRLQNVLLLSGGEKALAALALLLALFRYTPSPFCILDEVDAPLDESNVDRFTQMIQQMSRHTQFILITHNKRTMEIAEVLYGVTMEEPGISKLVSVRFDQAHAEPDEVAALA